MRWRASLPLSSSTTADTSDGNGNDNCGVNGNENVRSNNSLNHDNSDNDHSDNTNHNMASHNNHGNQQQQQATNNNTNGTSSSSSLPLNHHMNSMTTTSAAVAGTGLNNSNNNHIYNISSNSTTTTRQPLNNENQSSQAHEEHGASSSSSSSSPLDTGGNHSTTSIQEQQQQLQQHRTYHHHHPHHHHDMHIYDDDIDIDDDDDFDDEDDVDDDDNSDIEDEIFDPGQDHAIPDDPHSIDSNNAPTWKPQNTTSTCEFTHTIANYSQKRESGCKKAEYSETTIDSHGNRWRLIVYVNGNGRASNHHLSLFLQVADAEELPFGWKKAVSYVLTLEHPSGPTLGYFKRNPDKTFKLCPKAIDWGWSQFITSDRVQQEGYINNDSLIVRASVTVKSSSISIDPDDAELYLKCAVEEGNAEAVEACLEQGADVNCKFKDDLYTPLHTACSSSANDGSLDVLKLLLKRGANGNACNKWKETPLLIAANNGHRAAVEALLENGADPSMCSEAGWSALTFAAHKGYDDIVSLLLAAGAPVNCRVIEDFSTPLHKACAGSKPGHLSAVNQLISGQADVHALNKWRETPLLTAANHGQSKAVEALLNAGSDPCKCTDTGWSPLSIAAYKGHDEVVRLLLEKGAPTEEEDPTLSALLQAATKGLPDTVELLLRFGADHTVTTKKGDTALSILVEQNLIDAAVEMVTEYKASVPRCSRDRKKVQRARLLINLRVKQQQREGLLNDTDSEEGSENDESDDGSKSPLHDSDGSPKASSSISSKKKKKKGKSRESAEAQANKAAEALLLELEQENAKAQKDEAAANSKRNKKKKKKERERQQKLEEERLRKEKEQKAAEERERQRQLKEEKERQERIAKEKEMREKELQEAAERERIAARRKEKEEKEKKRRDQARKGQLKKEQEKREDQKKQAKVAYVNEKKTVFNKGSNDNPSFQGQSESHPAARDSSLKSQIDDNKQSSDSKSFNQRGWEMKNSVPKSVNESSDTPFPVQQQKPKSFRSEGSISTGNEQSPTFSVEDQLEDMANSVVGFLVSNEGSVPGSSGTVVSTESTDQLPPSETTTSSAPHIPLHQQSSKSFSIETAALAVFRQEKVNELLHRVNSGTQQPRHPLASIDIQTVRIIIYKWIVRASHHNSQYLDPIIPSWTDFKELAAFFQRQIISESNRKGTVSSGKIESMKKAGTFIAELCYSAAKEVTDFSKKYSESIPSGASDSALSMTALEVKVDSNNIVIAIEWQGQSKVYLSPLSCSNLRRRYCGPSHLLLTSIFSALKRYETLNMIVTGTDVDCRLPISTWNQLVSELNVTVELLSSPVSVNSSNTFCGSFADVDSLFGGSQPFSLNGNDAEYLLTSHGGSAAVLPPLDSNTASTFMRNITSILDVSEGKGLPVSVVVFLPMLCFRDLKSAPTIDDLQLLEPQLLTSYQRFIRHFELLGAGQHAYDSADNQTVVCNSGSILLFLQNEGGKMHFNLTEQAVRKIVQSLVLPSSKEGRSSSPRPFQEIPVSTSLNNPGTFSPGTNSNLNTNDIVDGMYERNGPSMLFEAKGSSRRRGRLFDLVDDGEDDPNELSGMFNNLNKSMFQSNVSQDVDIEAISLGLLGIGTNSNSNNTTGNHNSMQQSRRFN